MPHRTPVFIDRSGRRWQRIRRAAIVLGVLTTVIGLTLGLSLLFAPSIPTLHPQSLTRKPVVRLSERARLLDDIQTARNEGMFTPPGLRNTIQMPGNNGGANLGGAAVDPVSGTLFVVSKDLPAMLKLERSKTAADQYRSGFGFMFTSSGLPAIRPSWTSITAYDLNEGTIKWKLPLGEVPELAAKGIHDTGAQFPKVGPVVTAGGLIFAGTRDRKLRALDSATGKVLWEAELNAALEGMPAVYEMDGREYLVVCAAAQASTHTHLSGQQPPIPGAYVAFALPEAPRRVRRVNR